MEDKFDELLRQVEEKLKKQKEQQDLDKNDSFH